MALASATLLVAIAVLVVTTDVLGTGVSVLAGTVTDSRYRPAFLGWKLC